MKFITASFPYVRTYLYGLVWTGIDSLGSQGGVIWYHMFLRAYAGQEVHGAIGCMYSLVYLTAAIANCGLDKSLAPFLEWFGSSKKAVLRFLLSLCIQQTFIFFLSLLFVTFSPFFINHSSILSSLENYLSSTVIITLATTFFCESLRKTLRTFLQLNFYFRETAALELIGIGGNIVALPVLVHYTMLNLETVLLVNACMSILQTIMLGFLLRKQYVSLTHAESHREESVLFIRMAKTRFFSWIAHCLSQLYTGNFLVPLCALKFGIPSASLLNVMTSIAYWISLISKNVFGTTSNAILAHLKSRSVETQREAFHYLSFIANQGLYSLIIFLVINGKKMALAQVATDSPVTWSLLYFIILINFFEGFFVLYEKWYIFEEDAFLYVLLNSVSIGFLSYSIPYLSTGTSILATVLTIRILTFVGLLVMSYYRWQIWPPLRPHYFVLISSLGGSVLYYFLV